MTADAGSSLANGPGATIFASSRRGPPPSPDLRTAVVNDIAAGNECMAPQLFSTLRLSLHC